MVAGQSHACEHFIWKLSKIVKHTNNLGLRIREAANIGMKNFNVYRLYNSRTYAFFNLAVQDTLVVWLVFVKNFDLKYWQGFKSHSI